MFKYYCSQFHTFLLFWLPVFETFRSTLISNITFSIYFFFFFFFAQILIKKCSKIFKFDLSSFYIILMVKPNKRDIFFSKIFCLWKSNLAVLFSPWSICLKCHSWEQFIESLDFISMILAMVFIPILHFILLILSCCISFFSF